MSDAGTAAGRTIGSGAGRVKRAWGRSIRERRMAALAALALCLTLFLPWYQQTVIFRNGADVLRAAPVTLTGWGAFSFVEAVLLVLAAGVLVLLFQRAEGRRFRVPGGDGGVILVAGFLAAVLIMWRIIENQGTSGHGPYATADSVQWGIFVALAVSLVLAYAGSRIRAAAEPEPPPREDGEAPFWGPSPSPGPGAGAAGAARAGAAARAGSAAGATRASGRTARAAEGAPRGGAVEPGATRVSGSARPAAGQGGPAAGEGGPPAGESGPAAGEDAATRVSGRERDARPFGPAVVPEDPPVMRLPPRADAPPKGTEDPLTLPLDRHGDADR
ncbi:MAG: hypothetical protein JOZ64_09645 [Solirubrobacterales bacterium]|nr:hypothetical protein [Solirubrobacterales bacterium]